MEQNCFTYNKQQKKRIFIVLLICTVIFLIGIISAILIQSDARFAILNLLLLWGMLEIVFFLLWLDYRNWRICLYGSMVTYRNLFCREKQILFADVAEVFVNQYGRSQIKRAGGKSFLTKNVSYPGIINLLVVLKKRDVPFQFSSTALEESFLKYLEEYENLVDKADDKE